MTISQLLREVGVIKGVMVGRPTSNRHESKALCIGDAATRTRYSSPSQIQWGGSPMIVRIMFSAAVAIMAMTSIAAAQQPTPPQTIKRTLLQKFDVPGANYETVMGLAEIMPNSNIGRHTHPGIEGGYLVEGELVIMVEGQPPKTYKAGESWQLPPGAVHDAKAGAAGAKVLASYVVEKGKPLATPAP
jgi:quercetin dioxygenase-like cupin family protein